MSRANEGISPACGEWGVVGDHRTGCHELYRMQLQREQMRRTAIVTAAACSFSIDLTGADQLIYTTPDGTIYYLSDYIERVLRKPSESENVLGGPRNRAVLRALLGFVINGLDEIEHRERAS